MVGRVAPIARRARAHRQSLQRPTLWQRHTTMPIDPAFDSALRSAKDADDADIASILLSITEGIDGSLRCRWDTDSIFVSVGILGRLPTESAPARLVLGAFFGHQYWRDRYSDCARRLHELLPSRRPEQQRSLAIAWVRLALVAIDEQMTDKYTHARITLPLSEMQQSVSDFVGRFRAAFDDDARKTVFGLLSKLSSVHREQMLGRGSGSGSSSRRRRSRHWWWLEWPWRQYVGQWLLLRWRCEQHKRCRLAAWPRGRFVAYHGTNTNGQGPRQPALCRSCAQSDQGLV